MNQEEVQNIDESLMRMQMEYKNIQTELDKLPEHGKKIAIINRRRDLEGRSEQLGREIAAAKNQLRNKNLLHR